MRILALSDTHFGYEYGRTAQAKKEQINWGFDMFSHVLDFAKKNDIDCVLHGGDMFNRSQPKKSLVSKVYRIIEEFTRSDIDFVAIPGNHDRSRLPETLLNHYSKRIHFFNKSTKIDLDETPIFGFPFEAKQPKFVFDKIRKELINNPKQNHIILCHQLFDGASFGPHNHVFTNRPDTLKTNNFPENLLVVLSGHIHRTQSIQNNRVQYIGSLIRTSFMEVIEPKGFLIIEVEDKHVKYDFQTIPSYPMQVKELNISNTKLLASKLDDIDIESDEKTLLRFVGRNLQEKEIKFLWARFPAKEYPLLRFSPRYPNYSLRNLFN